MTELFLELVKMSLIGTLFAVAVMALRLACRKAPKWIFVALWGVVALRLILPISLESKISLVPDSLATGEVITNVSDAYVGPVDIVYEQDPAYRDALEAGGQPVHSEQGNYIVTQKDTVETPKTFGETVLPVLGWVWLAGVGLMLAYTAVSYFHLKGKMAVATLLEENIWQCEKADMPFVLGVFRPKIYLPYSIAEEDVGYVIAHEQAHIARHDHWWKPLGFFLLSVHWFNPVLWVAYILLCRDIEAACDEKVIAPMDKAHMRAYSTALLNCSIHRRRIAACPLAFGETGVKERIRRVMNYKKPAFWIILIAIVIGVVMIVCFCTDPLKKAENPDPTETNATEQTENKGNTNKENNTEENKDTTFKEATAAEMIAHHTTVLTGPVTQYVQVDDSRTVIYRLNYEKEDTAIPIFLPKLLPFSADAIACQAGLEKDLEFELRSVDEAVNHKTDCAVFYINFEAFLNGDILSVVIKSEASYDYRTYYTYNFDVTTGKRLDKKALVEKLQITNFDERLTQTAKNGFETKYGTEGNTDGFIGQQLNATMSPANLEGAQLYVGADGKLMTVIYVHAIAGAAGYYELVPFSYEQTENANPYPTLEITDYRVKIENNQKVFDSYPYFSVAFPENWKCYIRQGEDGSNYYFQDPVLGDKCRLSVSLAEAWTAKDRTEEEYRKLHPSRHLESLTTETIDGLQGQKVVYTYTSEGTEYVTIHYNNYVDRLRAFSLSIVYPADQKDVYEPIFAAMIESTVLYRYAL